ncbi:mechanosensitive ion channel family protein [Psychrobacter sp. APC 3426]|uniref:mechanosensitive ion channel family protein n=1 Tax=Psychrobacter sp. APC 3426 TaxID=3035177 RepID=UPI0025B46A8B|nr:mechanosensitive ion channel family protein [Psychrobacter sp. APC 3426]MDN3399645.1 mechanosensitive ion channel family protein [Psychrobacter sp. APC 3426]
MATFFDRPMTRRLLKAWGQILLLLSIVLSLPSYAAETNTADEAAILVREGADEASIADISAASSLTNNLTSNESTNHTTTEQAANEPSISEPTNEPDSSTLPTAPTPVDPPPVISGESTNNAQIETTPTPLKDNDIRQRISGIFSEIDGLQAVNVSVTQGVVTLTGETPNEKKAQQAINLTNRLTDVVTVEDRITRTLDVQDNVTTVYQGLKVKTNNLVKALPLLLVGIVLFGLVTWFGSWLSNRKNMWQRLTPNPFVAELLAQTVKVIFIIFGLILALSLIGAETILGTLLGGAGVIGIAVGFAVKDTIENYIASLMLSIRQPFRARDHILINDQEGIVVRLTSRATILMTLDGNQLRIPNAEVFKATILNYTKNPERRFTFELGVDANDDPLAAIKVGLDAIHTLAFVLDEPKAVAVITNVGDSNIILEFQVWVDQSESDFSKARSIAIRETKHALENEGFSLPEPIYRLRFNNKLEKAFEHMQGSSASIAKSDMTITPTTPEAIDKSQAEDSSTDDKDKQKAKARAKLILQGRNADDVLDARPNDKLMEKVEQEIAESSDETDLLSNNSPQE